MYQSRKLLELIKTNLTEFNEFLKIEMDWHYSEVTENMVTLCEDNQEDGSPIPDADLWDDLIYIDLRPIPSDYCHAIHIRLALDPSPFNDRENDDFIEVKFMGFIFFMEHHNDLLEKYERLRRNYNKLVDKYNRVR